MSLKVSKKPESSGVLKSNYESKIQKKTLNLRFMWTNSWLISNVGLNVFSKAISLSYLTLIPIILPLRFYEKLNSGVLNSNYELKVQK